MTPASASTARARSRSPIAMDVSVGARFDHENRKADILTALRSADRLPTGDGERGAQLLGRLAAGRRRVPRAQRHDGLRHRSRARSRPVASIPSRCPASESYGEEHAWNIEGGVKTSLADGKFTAAVSAFCIDWDDLQLNLPILARRASSTSRTSAAPRAAASSSNSTAPSLQRTWICSAASA